MILNMKEAVKTLFNRKQVIILTEHDEKLGGKLICKQGGKFAVKKLDGKEIPIWLSSMRFIGLDGFEVIECKGADGSSSILLENGIPDEVRTGFKHLDNPDSSEILRLSNILIEQHNQLIALYKTELSRTKKASKISDRLLWDIDKAQGNLMDLSKELTSWEMQYKKQKNKENGNICFRVGDPFDFENIVAAEVFNKGRSGLSRLFRRDQFEEFAIIQQKNGAIGIFSDFWTVYAVG